MEVTTWTENQVRQNMLAFSNLDMNYTKNVRKRKQSPLTLENENGDTFDCSFEMEGTIPGGATIKLLNELADCATKLNEFENDDVLVESKLNKVIRMVSLCY